MSSGNKPEGRSSARGEGKRDEAAPAISELDSSWGEDGEQDADATTIAKIPQELVAMSRRGIEERAERKREAPEKHEAITARPPPGGGESSVVVSVPHHQLPNLDTQLVGADVAPSESDEGDEDEAGGDDGEEEIEAVEELDADELDAGWDIEEERAAAADIAAGLDAEARRRAAEERAAQRKEKLRARKLAAKEKRKARADSIRQKQKKPKKRSTPPPRLEGNIAKAKPNAEASVSSREHPTIPPSASTPAAAMSPRRDLLRMVLFVAIVVVLGALAIGIARR